MCAFCGDPQTAKQGDPLAGSGSMPGVCMLFVKTILVPVYDALYTCNDMAEYFPITGKPAQTIDELDKFAYEVMEEEGKKEPYHRLSAHIIGYEKRRIRR